MSPGALRLAGLAMADGFDWLTFNDNVLLDQDLLPSDLLEGGA